MRGIWLLGMVVLLLAGCGEDAEPTRPNDFVPLTSIRIEAPYAALAQGTAGQFQAIGNYADRFERDITDQVLWQTDTAAVLTFADDQPGWGLAGSQGEVRLSAAHQGVVGELAFLVSNAILTGINLLPSEISRPVGLSQQFRAEGIFNDDTRQDLSTQADWLSSAPDRVTVDARGLARTLAIGDPVVITATFQGQSAQAQLTVTGAVLQSIQVTAVNTSLLVGETQQFSAQGTYSDGESVGLTSHADIEWTSSEATFATVGAKTGMVTAVASGSTNIVAALGGISGSTPVQVLVPTSITVTPMDQTVALGQTRQMTAMANFATGDARDVTHLVNWTSSNPAAATIDGTGLVRGVAAGQTTIQATKGVTGQTRLTILP